MYIGKVGDKGLDFIAEGPNGVEYYQVADTVIDQATLKRELCPLDSIRDHNPKFLLTQDLSHKWDKADKRFRMAFKIIKEDILISSYFPRKITPEEYKNYILPVNPLPLPPDQPVFVTFDPQMKVIFEMGAASFWHL